MSFHPTPDGGFVHIRVANDWPARDDDPTEPCCWQSVEDGATACGCWEPVYDTEQARPRPTEPAGCQPEMCGDCAYRPGSPEREGDPAYRGDQDFLTKIVEEGQPFWCHSGLRRQIGWRHPDGRFRTDHMTADGPAELSDGAYAPVQVEGVPYQADGSPALLCGGWSQRRLAHMQRDIPRRTE